MKRKWIIPIFIAFMILLLGLPSSLTYAQSDDQQPDFIVTLALMAVADDRLDGVLDNSGLVNLRDMVKDYYEDARFINLDEESRSRMNNEKSILLSALDQKINFAETKSKAAIMNYIWTASDLYEADGNFKDTIDEDSLSYAVFSALAIEYQPDNAVIDLLNKKLNEDKSRNLVKNLDEYTANAVEGGDQIIDTIYDFSAGLTKTAFIEQLSQTKPLLFINNGVRDVTVSIEYYAPPTGVAISTPGLNLTVQKEDSALASRFPQGNYTFCAHWQTDLDTDGDGIKDYDRMVTHIWLSSAHSSDPDTAEKVYVNSVGTTTPLGRCDGFKGEAPQTEKLIAEIFMTEDENSISGVPVDDGNAPEGNQTQESIENTPTENSPTETMQPTMEVPTETQPPQTGLTLTPSELANLGLHNYELTCVNEGLTDTRSVSVTWEFTETGVLNTGSQAFYAIVSPNVYQNDYPTTITFTTSGYLVSSFYTETSSEGVTTTSETRCTAIFQ